jgi:hypothetical protein
VPDATELFAQGSGEDADGLCKNKTPRMRGFAGRHIETAGIWGDRGSYPNAPSESLVAHRPAKVQCSAGNFDRLASSVAISLS